MLTYTHKHKFHIHSNINTYKLMDTYIKIYTYIRTQIHIYTHVYIHMVMIIENGFGDPNSKQEKTNWGFYFNFCASKTHTKVTGV